MAHFGASCDPVERNREFAKKLSLDFPLLSDTDRKVAEQYGILRGQVSRRVTIVVDPEGKVAWIENEVNVSKAGEQLVHLLKKLAVPKKVADADG